MYRLARLTRQTNRLERDWQQARQVNVSVRDHGFIWQMFLWVFIRLFSFHDQKIQLVPPHWRFWHSFDTRGGRVVCKALRLCVCVCVFVCVRVFVCVCVCVCAHTHLIEKERERARVQNRLTGSERCFAESRTQNVADLQCYYKRWKTLWINMRAWHSKLEHGRLPEPH